MRHWRMFVVVLCVLMFGAGFIFSASGVKAQRNPYKLAASKVKPKPLNQATRIQTPIVRQRKNTKGGRYAATLASKSSQAINPTATPPNDECSGAINIPSTVGFPVFSPVVDVTEASIGSNEPSLPTCLDFDDTGVDRSVWFTFTPQDSGPFVISTCENAPTGTTVQDTVLTLYTSNGGCGGFTEVPANGRSVFGCDDNSCDPDVNGQAVISTSLTANTTYYIVVREGLNNGYESIDETGLADVQVRIERTAIPARVGDILISEFRLSANRSSRDEFIELYNNTDIPRRIGNFRIRAFDPDFGYYEFRIPAGTNIPARGHYLIADVSSGRTYSLGSLTAVDGKIFIASDFFIDNEGLALVSGGEDADSDGAEDSPLVEIDKVGFTGATNSPFSFIEGTGLNRYTAPGTGEYSFLRKFVNGKPVDTNDNAADFIVVTTGNPTSFTTNVTTIFGAPGPQSTTSPYRGVNLSTRVSLLDTARAANQTPNVDRYLDAVNIANATQGTLAFRRTFTNITGAPITRLRFRFVNLTTLGTPSVGKLTQADLRALSSPGGGRVAITRTDGTQVAISNLTLEPPANGTSTGAGGGLNSTVRASLPTVLQGGMSVEQLAPNESVSLEFLFGVNSPRGSIARFSCIVEALP
ncbi:MAG: lamin tail domain-containing protein [Pyrinomonadaceae bacterium MAG19_C2-C3]|nr:lamin tail domain-containing protein [Pyrinomonadaceae bacterium MAG19_C2-C3]